MKYGKEPMRKDRSRTLGSRPASRKLEGKEGGREKLRLGNNSRVGVVKKVEIKR